MSDSGTILITGATDGLGRALADRLAATRLLAPRAASSTAPGRHERTVRRTTAGREESCGREASTSSVTPT
jgi:NAD(P)-dependent dehydrogenase (short-subunit alcohol dehydrogenase family)